MKLSFYILAVLQRLAMVATLAGVLLIAGHFIKLSAGSSSPMFLVSGAVLLAVGLLLVGLLEYRYKPKLIQELPVEQRPLPIHDAKQKEHTQLVAIGGGLLLVPVVVLFGFPLLDSEPSGLGTGVFGFLAVILCVPAGLIMLLVGASRMATGTRHPAMPMPVPPVAPAPISPAILPATDDDTRSGDIISPDKPA